MLTIHHRGMQNCFREYPEIYGAELQEEDEDALGEDSEGLAPVEATNATASETSSSTESTSEKPEKVADSASSTSPEKHERQERAKAATEQVNRDHEPEPVSEAADAIPKEWHDTKTEKN